MLESDGVNVLPIYFVPELASKWHHVAFLELIFFAFEVLEAVGTVIKVVDYLAR